MPFNKPPTTIAAQIALLKARGLEIDDDDLASWWLTNVSYYRLGGYWWSLQLDKIGYTFKPGSTWKMVTDRYDFDRKLRIIAFTAIERIEISVRTRLIYTLSHSFHSNWFEDAALFKNQAFFHDNLFLIDKDLAKSKEESIVNHHENIHPLQDLQHGKR